MRVRRPPKEDGEATVTPEGPRRIEATLLVVEAFTDRGGREWRVGDRAPIQSRAVREAAFEDSSRFAMEHETVPVDLEWLRRLDETYEGRYQAAVRAREAEKREGERALRAEFKAQDEQDPDLERRFKAQEKEDKERVQGRREQGERDQIEAELALRGKILSGFHYDE